MLYNTVKKPLMDNSLNKKNFAKFTRNTISCLWICLLGFVTFYKNERPEGTCGFSKKKSHKLIVISNFAICSQGLVIRSHELVICFRELDNPFFWIAVRSLDLHNSSPRIAIRSLD